MLKVRQEASSTLAARLQHRLPSARETLRTYLASLVPIVAWSVLHLLREGLPAWANQMRPWDVVGVVAYVQAFVLVESIAAILPLLLLSVILPLGWFREKFVPLGTAVVYLSAAWFVLAHFQDDVLRAASSRQLLPWAGAYLASLLLASAFIHRSARAQALIGSFVDRVTVLASAYLLLALAAVVIVVLRSL